MSKKYKFKRLLVRRYKILAGILFVLAAGLVLLPKYKKNEGIDPTLFVKNTISSERYISTDELADRMVNQDPNLLLIDIRSEKEFNRFSLPNAINIPLKKFLDKENSDYVDQDVYHVILFSNSNFYADQAWMIGNRLGYKNLFVLKGGLNEWFNTIISPQPPNENMPRKDFELFNFRKAAGMYFGIGLSDNTTLPKKKKKKVVQVKKKKKRKPEGGC